MQNKKMPFNLYTGRQGPGALFHSPTNSWYVLNKKQLPDTQLNNATLSYEEDLKVLITPVSLATKMEMSWKKTGKYLETVLKNLTD